MKEFNRRFINFLLEELDEAINDKIESEGFSLGTMDFEEYSEEGLPEEDGRVRYLVTFPYGGMMLKFDAFDWAMDNGFSSEILNDEFDEETCMTAIDEYLKGRKEVEKYRFNDDNAKDMFWEIVINVERP